MHFDPTISLGSIFTAFTVASIVGGYLWKIDRQLSKFLVEHEMLMADYCKAHGIKLSELPTRVR